VSGGLGLGDHGAFLQLFPSFRFFVGVAIVLLSSEIGWQLGMRTKPAGMGGNISAANVMSRISIVPLAIRGGPGVRSGPPPVPQPLTNLEAPVVRGDADTEVDSQRLLLSA
jgi:hypothetical protein